MTSTATLSSTCSEMRAIRIRDVIGVSTKKSIIDRHTNRLFATLVQKSVIREGDWSRLEEIEAAVAVGWSPLSGDEYDHASVLFVVAELLAREAQFARLRALASRLDVLAERIRGEYPFLAGVIEAESLVFQNKQQHASALLGSILGFGEEFSPEPKKHEINTAALLHIYTASALHSWLENGSSEALVRAQQFALRAGDGFLLQFLDLTESLMRSTRECSVNSVVLQALGDEFDDRFRDYIAAKTIETLFPAQRFAIESGVLNRDNTVAALPTSSGKTLLAEMRIVAATGRYPDIRTVYLAPYRLLARQVERELRLGLRQTNLHVKNFASGVDNDPQDVVIGPDIPDVAVMTPERFDNLLRLAESNVFGSEDIRQFIDSVGLIILDEAQLLGRSDRGPRLELIMVRAIQRLPQAEILALATSAQSTGYLASWLSAKDISYSGPRPTGSVEVVWKNDGQMLHRFGGAKSVGFELPRSRTEIESSARLALQVQDDKLPVLIIEAQRDWAESAARLVMQLAPSEGSRWRDIIGPGKFRRLLNLSKQVEHELGKGCELSQLVLEGLAYHHAGLPPRILRLIEELVRLGAIRILASTTTLAEGADLPFQVAVISHLHIDGNIIDRSLYENIVGRVGRANVASEGYVFVLEPRSAIGTVERELWREDTSRQVTSGLISAVQAPRSISQYRAHRDVRNQLIAWIGDRDSYVEDQVSKLSESTLAWTAGSRQSRGRLALGISKVMASLEEEGVAEAASPYKLTPLGARVRLAGISSTSCKRIDRRLADMPNPDSINVISNSAEISQDMAIFSSDLLLESEEVLEESIWLRRNRPRRNMYAIEISALLEGREKWPNDDTTFIADVNFLAGWVLGWDYHRLAEIFPVFEGRGAFSSEDPGKRSIDASEQAERLARVTPRVWNAIAVLAGIDPSWTRSWVRKAFEYGVPTETAANLIENFGISRDGAVKMGHALPSSWEMASLLIPAWTDEDLLEIQLSVDDISRLL